MDLQPFKSMIRENCGLCFEAGKEALLADRIRSRMAGRGLSESDYLACLRRDNDEVRALIDLLTINETYFFREPAHLELLAGAIVPPLLESGNQVRILCAGCSSGEEPYSVMMALLEKYGAGIGRAVAVIGVDIDSGVLRRAEEGTYSGLSFRSFPEGLREKYFERAGEDRFVIRDFVKERVRFMNVNLKSDAYPDALRDVDVIFYRNVSIYFEPETQRYIFDRLAGLLREHGWLFVSSTETLSHNHGTLSLVELDGVFCYRKKIEIPLADRRTRPAAHGQRCAGPQFPASGPVADASAPGSGKSAGGASHAAAPPETARAERPLFDEALALAKSRDYEGALKRIELLLAAEPFFAKGHLLKAGILVNLQELEEAERVCERSIELDRWSLEGRLLFGLIAKIRGNGGTAGRRFKEALYIQSSCWLAHFHLADVYRERGEGKKAAREYEIAARLLEKGDGADQGFAFFPPAFPAEQIVRLCRHNLKKMKME